MLTREQQKLLANVGGWMVVDALLDELRGKDTLYGGGSSVPGSRGHWFQYDRSGAWLEDWSTDDASPTSSKQRSWPKTRHNVLVKVTWAEAAAHGAALPTTTQDELRTLRLDKQRENVAHWEFTDSRGGWPWRQRFNSDEEHQAAQEEWDQERTRHLTAVSDQRVREKNLLQKALPLTVDDAPVDLLELLEEEAEAAAPTAMQSAALKATPSGPAAAPKPEPEGIGSRAHQPGATNHASSR